MFWSIYFLRPFPAAWILVLDMDPLEGLPGILLKGQYILALFSGTKG